MCSRTQVRKNCWGKYALHLALHMQCQRAVQFACSRSLQTGSRLRWGGGCGREQKRTGQRAPHLPGRPVPSQQLVRIVCRPGRSPLSSSVRWLIALAGDDRSGRLHRLYRCAHYDWWWRGAGLALVNTSINGVARSCGGGLWLSALCYFNPAGGAAASDCPWLSEPYHQGRAIFLLLHLPLFRPEAALAERWSGFIPEQVRGELTPASDLCWLAVTMQSPGMVHALASPSAIPLPVVSIQW